MESLKLRLQKRETEGRLRKLSLPGVLVDFCSNDYLGLAHCPLLKSRVLSEMNESSDRLGSTESRLVTGNSPAFGKLEDFLAQFHKADAALLFNSGFDANLGLISSVVSRGDTILYDSLSHASIRDGIGLSYAKAYSFRHNDLSDLEAKLRRAKGNIFVTVESVYSMDGDIAPLTELCSLVKKFNANLIVDEAHATGVFGEQGRGLICELNLQDQVFARVHTFGKAMGCHGAVVLGSALLKNFLINFARPFIYSTALAPHSLVAIRKTYEFMMEHPGLKLRLFENISLFRDLAEDIPGMHLQPGAIQIVIQSGNHAATERAQYMWSKGMDVRAILSPTVPVGRERLRICLHAFNSAEQIKALVNYLKN